MTATITSISGILKRLYPEPRVARMMYENHPFFGMVPKQTNFEGEELQISLSFAPTAGRSPDFTRAQANKAGAQYEPYRVTRIKDYSLFSLETEAIRASASNYGALAKATKTEGDAAFGAIEANIAWQIFRNGGGARGQIAATSVDTITLSNIDDIVAFEVGWVFQADDEDGQAGSTLDNPLDRATVVSVDVDLGEVTFDALPASFGVNDFLFMDGDYGVALSGLEAWIPATTPSATPFFGVDRSQHPTRLGGQRFTLTRAIHQTLTRGFTRVCARMKREQSKADYILMNPSDWAIFVNEQQDRTKIETMVYARNEKRTLDFGYSAIRFAGAMGMLDVIPDPDCPQGTAYILQMDTWKLCSLGKMPGWLNEDGQQMLRESAADAIEGRLGYYANLTCRAPGWNGTVDISDIVDNA